MILDIAITMIRYIQPGQKTKDLTFNNLRNYS